MSQIVWKYTTVSRNGDEVVTHVEGGRSEGGRLTFRRRRRIAAGSSPSAVSIRIGAVSSARRVAVGTSSSADE